MTPEQLAQIEFFFLSVTGSDGPPSCQICRTKPGDPSLSHSPAPTIDYTCTKCGFVTSFSAAVIGITPEVTDLTLSSDITSLYVINPVRTAENNIT
jgi:hypothetical protein